jgi:cystathionine gamma-synthase
MGSTSALTAEVQPNIALGLPVPSLPHAISVSLPTWRDNVGYEEGEKRVVDAMVSGYPRFFIHLSIQKVVPNSIPYVCLSSKSFIQLARVFAQKYAVNGEQCMLFPTQKVAEQCQSFMQARSVHARLIHLLICPEDKENNRIIDLNSRSTPDCASTTSANLHIALFPADAFQVAKEFWQHSGMGISSRLAEHCLSMLPEELTQPQVQVQSKSPSPTFNRLPFKVHNKHYSAKGHVRLASIPSSKKSHEDDLSLDHSTYLEERYGRNLALALAPSAKRALRRRIAGVLIRDDQSDGQGEPSAGEQNLIVGPSSRGVVDVSEHDVFLFSTGMSAIWNTHYLALAVRPSAKSVCFGFVVHYHLYKCFLILRLKSFPYTDTLKILQKWGPGCHFFGYGLDSDIDEFEALLEKESSRDPSTPPILALFTEFPSNPLLRSADLPRLRALADKYDFLIVVDETIGNFVNVEVLPYADVVVSSLSKVFSGVANVMGGR